MVGPKKWRISSRGDFVPAEKCGKFATKDLATNPRTRLPSAKKTEGSAPYWMFNTASSSMLATSAYGSQEDQIIGHWPKHTPQKNNAPVGMYKKTNGNIFMFWLWWWRKVKIKFDPHEVGDWIWLRLCVSVSTNQTIIIWNKRGTQKQCFSLKLLGRYATCSCKCFFHGQQTYITCFLSYNLQLFVIV